ncbi:hypothetical protein LCL89_02205 [Halobacillus yeomjeoni]|uniref:Uncharacterized protein n=1 Tax=Halobacillus yeomjeoni TaxID=311194 RepID=A0A931MUX0_9BACI|nr:hypothetical protein [Halobacillus yeomjeoni]MBH0229771.1 hypothetical protein [Halobacillus yeomjeoni]MCA0982852.1 hypothetical protein [Halobacillus yeomjeoni]
MNSIVTAVKDMALDLYAMIRGFLYGFLLVTLFIIVIGLVIAAVVWLKGLIF